MIAAQLRRQQRDERLFERGRAGVRPEVGRGASREHFARVHRGKPIEPFRFLHIGGRDHHAHAGAARAHAVDQLPELPTRKRIDAGGWLIEDQEVGIVDQTATEAELLAHAAREFLREPIRERREPGAFQQFHDFLVPLEARAAKQAAEELYVLAHAQVGVEVLAETLRHVGDARTDSGAMRGVRHVAPENEHASGLDLARARDEARAASTFQRHRAR